MSEHHLASASNVDATLEGVEHTATGKVVVDGGIARLLLDGTRGGGDAVEVEGKSLIGVSAYKATVGRERGALRGEEAYLRKIGGITAKHEVICALGIADAELYKRTADSTVKVVALAYGECGLVVAFVAHKQYARFGSKTFGSRYVDAAVEGSITHISLGTLNMADAEGQINGGV